MIDQKAIRDLSDWMAGGAQPPRSLAGNVTHLLEGLVAAGVPVSRFALFILTIHPTIAGKRILWTPEGGVDVTNAPHAFFQSEMFLKSPARAVYESKQSMRRCFAHGDEPDYPDLAELRDAGATDYYAQPMIYTDGTCDGVTWQTEAPGGFTDEMIEALDLMNAGVSRLLEIYILKINTIALLSTYVGRDAGGQVLAGQIQRGDVERIPSVILFADLKGFTELSNTKPIEEVMAALNLFFEAMEKAIQGRGGEILKFIGDGLLAIFPVEGPAADAAARALAAVDDAQGAIGDTAPFRAALHIGETIYGNIGGATRLDFTAIGPDVNLTARILDQAAGLGADIVCTAAFAELAGTRAEAIGEVALKGFAEPAPVCRL